MEKIVKICSLKKYLLVTCSLLVSTTFFAQEKVAQEVEKNEEMVSVEEDILSDEPSSNGKKKGHDKKNLSAGHKPGLSDVPSSKRPKAPDQEKIKELNDSAEEDEKEKFAETLKFGLEDDIIELLNKFDKNDDQRFVEEIYDLFQETKNVTLREKILGYFGKLEDPCLEDYAVMVLNDPYDEKQTTVDAVFSYTQKVKTKQAIPAVLNLLESEEEKYFNGALTTLGAIGDAEEAVYIADYLEREDLSIGQKQQLVRVLGQIKAVETYDKLAELAQDRDENSFIRMYSAEAIGSMQKKEAVEVLVELFEDNDPNLRSYVIKGLVNFKEDEQAKKVIIQGTRDAHYKVRLEAISAVKKNEIKEAVPYLIYRAKNDPEQNVKDNCIPVIAKLNTKEGNEYLIKQITDKKVADNPKIKVAKALLENGDAGLDEMIALAREVLKDDRRKPLRYALGKEFAKYKKDEFSEICREYIASKDVATQGTGLDMYSKGRYSSVEDDVRQLADKYDPNAKSRNANAEKAAKILGVKAEKDKKAETEDKTSEAK